MSKPFDMDLFLAGVLTGSHATRARHLRQAKTIQTAVSDRWGRDNPWAWQRKHLVWYLNCHLASYSSLTQYYYRLTVKLLILRLGRPWEL